MWLLVVNIRSIFYFNHFNINVSGFIIKQLKKERRGERERERERTCNKVIRGRFNKEPTFINILNDFVFYIIKIS